MEKELTCLRSIIADCDERITAALKTRMECIEGIITYKRKRCNRKEERYGKGIGLPEKHYCGLR